MTTNSLRVPIMAATHAVTMTINRYCSGSMSKGMARRCGDVVILHVP